MSRRLLFLLTLLTFTILTGHALADEGDDEGDEDDDDSEASVFGVDGEGLGEVAQVLLIATLAIVAWKPAFKWLRANGAELFDKEPRAFKKSLGVANRRFMRVHTWLGLAMAVIGTVHGYVLEWHWTLWLAMAFLWVLVISGYLMQSKWPPKEFRKGTRLLHMQRLFSGLAIALLLIGHALLDG